MELGYQRWDDLLFLHWEVPRKALLRVVDPRLELDTFEGRCFVSLTPFTLTHARLRFLPEVPGLRRFHELNFRTYVVHRGVRGIWFFSLDAANAMAAMTARWTFGLPYYAAKIDRTWAGPERRFEMTREAVSRSAECEVSWRPGRALGDHPVGSLEHFLAERYSLFSHTPMGGLVRVDVQHAPWPLQAALDVRLEETLSVAHGLPGPRQGLIAHATPGVDVAFVRIKQVEPAEAHPRHAPEHA